MTTNDHPVDQKPEPPEDTLSAPVPSVDRVNGMMGRWRRLNAEIAEYDRLHQAEIDRLNERRELAVGPAERRISRLRRAVEEFAVESYLHWGKKSLRVPNGDIQSRPVVHDIAYDGAKLFDWAAEHGEFDGIYELRPWFDMKKLRKWLDDRVDRGHIQRLVMHAEGPDGVDFELVDEQQGWHREFMPGWEGVWFWTETGAEEYGRQEGEILPGVTWTPKGTFGSGRNIKVKL